MKTISKTIYSKNPAARQMFVTRQFDSPVDLVWKAWTRGDILDEWWAPRPWKTNTVRMDFRNGGHWLYYMEGPDGSRHYCRADYNNIVEGKSFEGYDGFCDEKGVLNLQMPRTLWKVSFTEAEGKTQVIAELTYGTQSDLEKIIEMGFEQGFAMAHDNLDELLPTLK